MVNISRRVQLSLLYATSTLLPIFLFGQLSLFTPLSILYLSIFYSHTYYCNLTVSTETVENQTPIEIHTVNILWNFIKTYLTIIHPALFYASFLISHTREFNHYAEKKFVYSQLCSIFSPSSAQARSVKNFKSFSILRLYDLSINLLIMRLINPYIPLSAIELSQNHLPLCILAKKLSQNHTVKTLQGAHSTIIHIIYGMEDVAEKRKAPPTPVNVPPVKEENAGGDSGFFVT